MLLLEATKVQLDELVDDLIGETADTPQTAARLSMKQELAERIMGGGYRLTAKAESTGDPQDFISEELLLALLLSGAMSRKAAEILGILDLESDHFSMDRFTEKVVQAQRVASSTFTSEIERRLSGHISALINKGADKLDGRSLISTRAHDSIMQGMVKSSKYYTNNYFNRIVMPELYRQVEKVTNGQTDYTMSHVREALDNRLKSVPYWKTVANSASSRSYHYGVMKAGSLSGYRIYEFIATLDDRTTDVCRNMNGKQFQVQEAVQLVEQAANMEAEEATELMPFVTDGDLIAEYSNSQLAERGLMVPPLHYLCRSTVYLMY